MNGAPADPLILSQRNRIGRFAVEPRIPAMYEFREFMSDGGLLSHGPNLMEMFRRSVTDADKILNGAKPSDIPIERPKKFELSVNLKAADECGCVKSPASAKSSRRFRHQ
jgi:putative ABC transport system substrate-binding protein